MLKKLGLGRSVFVPWSEGYRLSFVWVTYLRKRLWLFGSSCLGAFRRGILGLKEILTSTFLAIRRDFRAMPRSAGLPATAMGAAAPREVLVQMLVYELVP